MEILTTSPDFFLSVNYTSTCIIGITATPLHKVIFCVSRLAGDAQRWWELQARILGKSADGEQFYPAYDDFEEKLRNRFWKDADEQIKRAQWEKLRQVNYKDGDKFFQEFEELAHYAGVRGNEQVMVAQIKRVARETSKNTIYAGDGDLPALYDDWKSRLLRMTVTQTGRRYGTNATNDKGASTKGSIDRCTDTENSVGNYLRRTRTRHGYWRSHYNDEVLPMRKARSLQVRLLNQAEIQGRTPSSSKRPLGQGNTDDNRGGKRGHREVIDSTCSART